jgi:starvation-inducible DNA-binding protein
VKIKRTHNLNNLPEKKRIEMLALLQASLADYINLMMQSKQAHWNMKGPKL